MTARADIALLIHSMDGGGAERVCLNLCAEFVARGLSVDLVLCAARGAYLSSVPDGVRIVDCGSVSTVRWTRAVARYFRASPSPVMVAMMEGAGLVAVAARMLTRARVRLAVVSHNTISVHEAGETRLRQRVLAPLAWRALIPRADMFVGVSQGVSDDFARYFGLARDRVATIYNPVVDARLHERALEPPGHPWLREPRGARPRTVVAAGRLARQKGFDTLMRAMAAAGAGAPDLRLVILGEGEDRAELEALARELGLADRVALAGFDPNPFAALANADLFVLSSRWEGLPTVLIEALACGCPVVATDCPSGPSEILEGGAWGPLVPVDDPEALARAMLSTLQDPLPAERLRKRGDAFSVARSAGAYLRLLGLDRA